MEKNPFKLVFKFIIIVVNVIHTVIFTSIEGIGNVIMRIVLSVKPIIILLTRFFRNLFHKFGTFFPQNIKKGLEKRLVLSGLTQNPEETLGIVFIYSLTIPTVVFVILTFIFKYSIELSALISIGSLIGVWILFHVILLIIIDRRTQGVENVLPDVLSMISQNMRAGMTPYNALWAASRPEFGPLAMELQNVARDTLTGVSFEDALISMTHRIKSSRLKRAVGLMIQGMRSGGELPAVLQEIADDIRTELALIRRMKTETTMQVMFIAFALIIGAPLLFGASNQFVVVFSKTLMEINIPDTAVTGSIIRIHEFPVTSSPHCGYLELNCEGKFNFKTYCLFCLIISAFFGSIIIGFMRTGRITSAYTVSLIPIIMFLSIIVFIVLNSGLNIIFSSMISGM